jgi:coenzyme F420-dependent glucose-6-phosphate dehydrogenase
MQLGYWLSSEEHGPGDLVGNAARAEEAGFAFAIISDHFHPWIGTQGQSPFVWSVLGGISQVTQRLRLGTGVTCPLIRLHPAIVAQAAATAATMLPGRFFLGVGTGENLNEHILGDRWPPADQRLEMLEEAIEVLRLLWRPGSHSHRGRYYQVEDAQVYTLPEQPIPLMVAASGARAAELAGQVADGLISVLPNAELPRRFDASGGQGKPRYGQVRVCWAADEGQARRTVHKIWPTGGLPGVLSTELREPALFEAASSAVTEAQAVESVACGPDPDQHLRAIQRFVEAGFDHVAVHQVGPDQAGFFEFYAREILPKLR